MLVPGVDATIPNAGSRSTIIADPTPYTNALKSCRGGSFCHLSLLYICTINTMAGSMAAMKTINMPLCLFLYNIQKY